jgi:uncharacterized protein
LLLATVGLTSATIVLALAVGIAVALGFPGRLAVGLGAARAAQALVGVGLGASLTQSTLDTVVVNWLPVLLTTVAGLGLSLLLGFMLGLRSSLDPVTATLSVVPGGATGIVALARELGGDDRLVAFSQYLRVVVILLITPVVAAAVIPSGNGGAMAAQAPAPLLPNVPIGVAVAIVGWRLGALTRLPAPSLLGPLVAAGVCSVLLPALPLAQPQVLSHAAFALVGLDVGLRFTRAEIRRARRILPAYGITLACLLLSCLALAIALAAATPVTLTEGYLATTPGGLTVVAATAHGADADTGLVVAIQTVRLVLMLLLAPLAVRMTVGALSRRRERSRTRTADTDSERPPVRTP